MKKAKIMTAEDTTAICTHLPDVLVHLWVLVHSGSFLMNLTDAQFLLEPVLCSILCFFP